MNAMRAGALSALLSGLSVALAASNDPRDLNGVYMTAGMPGAGMGAAPGGVPGGGAGAPGGAASGMATGPIPGVPNTANLSAAGVPPLQDNLRMRCFPQFQLGSSPYAGQIIQTADRIYLISEFNHMIRRIYLNESFPTKIEPSYLGHSIGHWQGNTLMVETRGLKTAALGMISMQRIDRVVEKIYKTDTGTVVQEATLEGVDARGQPTTMSLSASNVPRPDLHLYEFICEDTADTFYTK